jgi:hypothetical protein
MFHGLRFRFWLEATLGSTTGVLGAVTLVWRDWIEVAFRADPDHGNGTAEWLVVAILLGTTFMLGARARLEWRRARLAEA